MKKVLVIIFVIALTFSTFSVLAYAPTEEVSLDGEVEPFAFSTEFDRTRTAIDASTVDVPIYKQGIAVKLKWIGIKNATSYKFSVKDLKTGKTVYSATTKSKTASFPAAKNDKDASYLATISALNSKGKSVGTLKIVFHTGKMVVNTHTKIHNHYVLYQIKDLKKDLVGVAYEGMYGEIQDDGTLRILGEQ